jgi:hypothetical protein
MGLKIWAYVALAATLIGAASFAYSRVYRAGYNAAIIVQQQIAIKRQNVAIVEARLEWEATAAAAEVEIRIEERIVERIRVVEREIPVVVERIVEVTPECNDLGPEFLRVYNDAIRASHNRDDGGPDTTTEPDQPMS